MLHLDYSKFKLDKVFLELRYKDSFKIALQESRYKILEKLSKKYPAYQNNDPEAISFLSPNNQFRIHIGLNRCLIDWDQPLSLNDFIKSAKSDLSFIFKELEIETLLRVGLRTFNNFEGNSQQAVSQYIFKEYLSSGFKSTEFADEYFNPKIQFSGKKESILFNFGISYQQEQIITGSLNGTVHNEIRNMFVIDFDCYKENIKVSRLEKFLLDTSNLNSDLPNYLKGINSGVTV